MSSTRAQRRLVAVGRQKPPVVVVHLERAAIADGVHDQQITALALQFALAWKSTSPLASPVSAANPTIARMLGSCPSVRARTVPARYVVGPAELDGRSVEENPGTS